MNDSTCVTNHVIIIIIIIIISNLTIFKHLEKKYQKCKLKIQIQIPTNCNFSNTTEEEEEEREREREMLFYGVSTSKVISARVQQINQLV